MMQLSRAILTIVLLASLFVTCVGHASAQTVQVTEVKIMVTATYGSQPAGGMEVKLFLYGSSIPVDWGTTNAGGNYEFTVSLSTTYNITVNDYAGTIKESSLEIPAVIYYESPSFTYEENFNFVAPVVLTGAPITVVVRALDVETHVPLQWVTVTEHWLSPIVYPDEVPTKEGSTDAFGNVTLQNITGTTLGGVVAFYGVRYEYADNHTAELTVSVQSIPQIIHMTLFMQHDYVPGTKPPQSLCSFAMMICAAVVCSILIVGRKLSR